MPFYDPKSDKPKGVECTAKGCGKRFTSLAGVRKHFRDTGHSTFKNVRK